MTEEAPVDQAPEQSIEERIANQFDDQPVEEAAPEAEAAPEESDEAEIEYEGERFRIPKKLEKAIMQERDYTQKTQSLAEQRKQVEYSQKAYETAQLERQFHESVAPEVTQLNMLDNYIQQMQSTNVNDLPMEDGFRHWMQLQQAKEQRDALQRGIESKRSAFTQTVAQKVEALKAEAQELLAKQIPGITPEVIAQTDDYARRLGYTDHDIGQFRTDPRASAVLIKAMKYDQLQANKATAVKSATPVVKPGSANPMPQEVKDKLAFRKALKAAPNSQSKARLIEQHLANRF